MAWWMHRYNDMKLLMRALWRLVVCGHLTTSVHGCGMRMILPCWRCCVHMWMTRIALRICRLKSRCWSSCGRCFLWEKKRREILSTVDSKVSTELHDNGQLTSILVDQRTYIDKIVPMEISHTTGSQDRCLEQQEHSDYRGIVEALLWASTSTRRDHADGICQLSQQTGAPTERHAIQANKLLNTMKKKTPVLRYPQLTGELRLIGYHDSSWGNAEDGRTVGG